MSITVTLFAELRQYLPKGQVGAFQHSLAPRSTVETVLNDLGVPPESEITIGLNGELGNRDNELRDGDDLQLFTPMQGG